MKIQKNFISKIATIVLAASLILTATVSVAAKTTINEGLVDIGDISLYAKIMGNDSNVSVVFDSGYGDGIYTYSEDSSYETWHNIQSEISKYAKTITYDRAGLGQSDSGVNRESLSEELIDSYLNGEDIPYDESEFDIGSGKTAIDRARDLHALLESADVDGPYLLVIHSVSMLEAVEFAKEYPGEVAGIVSVDGTSADTMQKNIEFFRTYAPEVEDLFLSQFQKYDGTLSEIIQSSLQVKNAGDVLRNIPLTILHPSDSGDGPEYQQMSDEIIRKWTTWSNYSKLIFVPDTSHYIMKDQPQYVVKAIKNMLKEINNSCK
ncbi:MAG: hypothetical protein K0R05_3378 [Anaerocolumna sp.]|jgi:pimeloyl-ACP methyl ester carboxylesterase|nr:hypothetical protein [Anaerocolumna sp.]